VLRERARREKLRALNPPTNTSQKSELSMASAASRTLGVTNVAPMSLSVPKNVRSPRMSCPLGMACPSDVRTRSEGSTTKKAAMLAATWIASQPPRTP
jgi:hypothetical protein